MRKLPAFILFLLAVPLSAHINTWQTKGVVIAPSSADQPGQPNVCHTTGTPICASSTCHIVSAPCFKMWFGSGNGVCYAESTNGTSWTRYSMNPVITGVGQGFPKMYISGSTTYIYANAGSSGDVQSFSSTNDTTFTQQQAHALVALTQMWESNFFGQLEVAGQEGGGTWWGYYTSQQSGGGGYALGCATASSLGGTWTKCAGNPVVTTNQPSNFFVHQVGGAYYAWTQILLPGIPTFGGGYSIPSDITRFVSSNVSGPWTALTTGANYTATLYRTRSEEGVASNKGQVGDPSLVSDGTNLWQFYTDSTDGTGTSTYQISVAEAPSTTFAQLVRTYEGVQDIPITTTAGIALNFPQTTTDNFTRSNANPIGGNWSTLATGGNYANAQILSNVFVSSTLNDNADSYWNAIVWPNDQCTQITAHAAVDSSSYLILDSRTTAGTSTTYSAYRTYFQGPLGALTGLRMTYASGGSFPTLSGYVGASPNVSVNDVLTQCAIGTTETLYQNGNLIGVASDTNLSSGNAGAGVASNGSAVTSASISLWTGGAVQNAPALAGRLRGAVVQ